MIIARSAQCPCISWAQFTLRLLWCVRFRSLLMTTASGRWMTLRKTSLQVSTASACFALDLGNSFYLAERVFPAQWLFSSAYILTECFLTFWTIYVVEESERLGGGARWRVAYCYPPDWFWHRPYIAKKDNVRGINSPAACFRCIETKFPLCLLWAVSRIERERTISQPCLYMKRPRKVSLQPVTCLLWRYAFRSGCCVPVPWG